MTADTIEFPRAFAVWFKDLGRWDASSFHRIKWHWPQRVMAPIGSALRLRKERVDKAAFKFSDLQPITIHFDGSVDKRIVDANREYSMDLWFARPGDIVVAKIDLKNGAVGIVPPDWKNVVVTGHFAVYETDRTRLVPEYLQLIIQAGFFKAHLWRNKVGAEGRKEVKLDFFEEEHIPIPSLVEQKAIVASWCKAKNKVSDAAKRVVELEIGISNAITNSLGLKHPERQPELPKVLCLWWRDMSLWGAGFNRLPGSNADLLRSSRYPTIRLGDVAYINPITKIQAAKDDMVTFVPMEAVSDIEGKIVAPRLVGLTQVANGYTRFQENDILWAKITPCMQNGKSAVAHNLEGGIGFGSTEFHVIRSRDYNLVLPDYIWILIRIKSVRELAKKYFVGSAGQQRVPPSFLEDLVIPLPPLAVQKQIMAQVAAGRAEIAREREAADRLVHEINAEIEALILGTKKVSEL
jgi:type I restriction enzyme S subunit